VSIAEHIRIEQEILSAGALGRFEFERSFRGFHGCLYTFVKTLLIIHDA
jgi:hypothetical protein